MVTVITATYNRAYILDNLYKSLQFQINKNFEWIIIDDGSIDETESIIKNWLEQKNVFEIIYHKKKNGGKHRAINYAVKIAKYNWCFIVDSDDFLKETAIECISNWVKTIENDSSFAGVSGLKGYSSTGLIIGKYPKSKRYKKYVDATNLQRKRYKLNGDKAEVYRTSILKKYPFPEFDGENFITEASVWDAIAKDGFKLRWFNEIIYLCEYLEDGLTRNNIKNVIDNFNGYTYVTIQALQFNNWIRKQIIIANYIDIATKKEFCLKDVCGNLNISMLHIIFCWFILYIKKTIKIIINR